MQAELEGKIIVDITNLLYLPAFSDDSNWGQVGGGGRVRGGVRGQVKRLVERE